MHELTNKEKQRKKREQGTFCQLKSQNLMNDRLRAIAEQSDNSLMDKHRLDRQHKMYMAAQQMHGNVEKNIESGDEVKFYFQRLLKFDYCIMLTISMSITLSILYSDADFQNDTSNSNLCLLIMSGLVPVSVVVAILRYQAQVQLQISETELSKFDNIFTAGKYEMIVEIVVLLLQPYPFFNEIRFTTSNIRNNYTFDFKLNYLLVLLGFARAYILLRVFLLKTEYMSPRANRVCRLYEAKSDYLYSIKCLFKDYPLPLIGVFFAVSIIIFALCIRITERDLKTQDPLHGITDGQDLENFANALWLTIITMTTVGYGDFYPRTLFGRIIDVFLIIWGIFIVSLMVVVLTNTLNMDLSEKRALTVLNRLDLKAIQKKHAANYIINAWKKQRLVKQLAKLQQKGPENEKEAKLLLTEIDSFDTRLNQYSRQFKEIERLMQSMFEIDDIYEQMTRQFQNLMDEMNELMSDQSNTDILLKKFLDNKKAEGASVALPNKKRD